MPLISISQLKVNPGKAIEEASDIPVAVQKRNKVKAYLIGKDLFEKIVSFIEDRVDRLAVEKTDFSKGKDFEKIAGKLGM